MSRSVERGWSTTEKWNQVAASLSEQLRSGGDVCEWAQQNYDRLDPISTRMLVDAVEARARRMRAEAVRELLAGAWRFVREIMAGMSAARTRSGSPALPGRLQAHAE